MIMKVSIIINQCKGESFTFDLTTCNDQATSTCSFTTGPWIATPGATPNCLTGVDSIIVNGSLADPATTYYVSSGSTLCNITSVQIIGANVRFTFNYNLTAAATTDNPTYTPFAEMIVQDAAQVTVTSQLLQVNALSLVGLASLTFVSDVQSNFTGKLVASPGSTIVLANTTGIILGDGSNIESSTITGPQGSFIAIDLATVTFNNSQINSQGSFIQSIGSELVLANTTMQVALLKTLDGPFVLNVQSTSSLLIGTSSTSTYSLALQGEGTTLNIIPNTGEIYATLSFESLAIGQGSYLSLNGSIAQSISIDSAEINGALTLDSFTSIVSIVSTESVPATGSISISNVSDQVNLGLIQVSNLVVSSVSGAVNINSISVSNSTIINSVNSTTQSLSSFSGTYQANSIPVFQSNQDSYFTALNSFDSVNTISLRGIDLAMMNNVSVTNATFVSFYNLLTFTTYNFTDVQTVSFDYVIINFVNVYGAESTNITVNQTTIGTIQNFSPAKLYYILQDQINSLGIVDMENMEIVTTPNTTCSLQVTSSLLYYNDLNLYNCTLALNYGAHLNFTSPNLTLRLDSSTFNIDSSELTVGTLQVGPDSTILFAGPTNITTDTFTSEASLLSLFPSENYNFDFGQFTVNHSYIWVRPSIADFNTQSFRMFNSTLDIDKSSVTILNGSFIAEHSIISVNNSQMATPFLSAPTILITLNSSITFDVLFDIAPNTNFTILQSTANNLTIDPSVNITLETEYDPKLIVVHFDTTPSSLVLFLDSPEKKGDKGLKTWELTLIIIGATIVAFAIVTAIVYKVRKYHNSHPREHTRLLA
ncbi:hypothetical protein DFA_09806 [Cavenderia fasciculata]|uniref:Transmembrane protein n=1 Tax=Cavenderia fasciculata TaxID=261658 RepID=F4QAR8_CACFS|nr:uncharacterized protein DFA_09806 [Cavenderia fasciculata]EGG14986.1 hypothetical protein DFA_09806 [Cavenderia fasciculata]|eukprot:XP_004351706.1 hypothetical protein DFA_09806 [Cavenderia fasciculata]